MSKIADQTCTRVTVTVIAREARNYGHSYRRSALIGGGKAVGGRSSRSSPGGPARIHRQSQDLTWQADR